MSRRRGGELWQGGEEESCDKKERRREGEKESCDKEERRRAVARTRVVRVYLDIISR